jgi:hypothetical protein
MFVFIIWSWTSSIDVPYIQNEIIQFIVIYVINFISAFGFFSIFVSIARYLLEKPSVVKKKILGSSYFEGIWVGHYIGPGDKKPVIFYQIIEQAIDGAHISSYAYNVEDMSYRGSWEADFVLIDPRRLALFFYPYQWTGLERKADGQMKATSIQRKGSPYRIDSNAFNMESKNLFRSEQIKISDKIVMNDNDKNRILQRALKFYNDNSVTLTITKKENTGS